jgi:signal transduction histidine kinase
VIDEVIERMSRASVHTEIHVQRCGKAYLCADQDRLEQVLANLLSNALKYGEASRPIELDVRVRDPGEIEVVVTNRGRGIAPEDLPRVFNRFERSREAKAGRAPGLGLGLFICKGIIEAHGGRIWAESTPGETTSFHFTLPLVTPTIGQTNLGVECRPP